MNEIIEQKIKAARAEVEKSRAPSERKDGLQAMLDHAHSCANGHPDKIAAIAEAMSYLIVHIVRSETREPERFETAIAAHRTECRASRMPRNLREAAMAVAAQYPILTILAIGWAAERGWLAKLLEVFQ